MDKILNKELNIIKNEYEKFINKLPKPKNWEIEINDIDINYYTELTNDVVATIDISFDVQSISGDTVELNISEFQGKKIKDKKTYKTYDEMLKILNEFINKVDKLRR